MRDAFAKAMTEIAKEREDVCLLSGDIGNRMFDGYKEVAPARFFNCGIAEANMMSMATGMGLSGLRPVVYTITPFTTTRCLEQIRTGVAYHEAPVVIVGTGSGLSYAELGTTHHSLEDIAIMRTIPNMNICAPIDSIELVAHLKDAIKSKYPSYIRIGKKGEPNIVNNKYKLGIGKANMIKKGGKIAILAVGPIIKEAIIAHESLKKMGIEINVASMGSVEPIDTDFLHGLIEKDCRHWITLEEHYRDGGLGTKILEWSAENAKGNLKITRIGAPKQFIHELGAQEYVRKKQRLTEERIIEEILSI